MVRLIFDGEPGTVEVLERRGQCTWRYLSGRRAHTPSPRQGAARGRARALLAAAWAAGMSGVAADWTLRRRRRAAA